MVKPRSTKGLQMKEKPPMQAAARVLREKTGIVIPVYFGARADPSRAAQLLSDTVHSFVAQVTAPDAVCLAVDGRGPGEAAARHVASGCGVRVVVSEKNGGKLHAVRQGMAPLLSEPGLEYFTVVDQDGDHFANELLNFVRAARHIERCTNAPHAVILGRRISRHRPLGFLRGELEELADRVLLDALHYDAAVNGAPLRLEFANVLDEFPDFHSGYKLFSREVARSVFLEAPRLCGVSDDCYYRHACEAAMSVEALKSGAVLGVVNRSTLDEQPISTFAELDRRRLVADKMIWPCRRLGVPAAFVDQWLRNHIPRLLLGTLTPAGGEELLAIRELVAAELDPAGAVGGGDLWRPRFV